MKEDINGTVESLTEFLEENEIRIINFKDEAADGYEDLHVTLTDENDEESDFLVLNGIEVHGQSYWSIMPLDIAELEDETEGEGFSFIIKVTEESEDVTSCEYVEDEEEFEKISKYFETIFAFTESISNVDSDNETPEPDDGDDYDDDEEEEEEEDAEF